MDIEKFFMTLPQMREIIIPSGLLKARLVNEIKFRLSTVPVTAPGYMDGTKDLYSYLGDTVISVEEKTVKFYVDGSIGEIDRKLRFDDLSTKLSKVQS